MQSTSSNTHKYSSETMSPNKFLLGDILIFTGEVFELVSFLEENDKDYELLLWDLEESMHVVRNIPIEDDSILVIRHE